MSVCQCPQLPALISYLQALAVPVIAAFGSLIAGQQMFIAREKLRHEVFYRQYESRMAVYQATRKFLQDAFLRQISEDEIRAYGLQVLDAEFLFDKGLYKYLNEIRQKVHSWHDAESSAAHARSFEEKDQFEAIAIENRNWIMQQGDERFPAKFAPFLTYRPPKWRWRCFTSAPRSS